MEELDRRYMQRRDEDKCIAHSADIRDLFGKNTDLALQVKAVSSSLSLLIKTLAGTVVIVSAILGSIYLSVAKIDNQVAIIVTNTTNFSRELERVERNITVLQDKTNRLEINQETMRTQIKNQSK